MVEEFFFEQELSEGCDVDLHNVIAFRRDRSRWFDTLDQLGEIYDGELFIQFFDALARNKHKDQLVMVLAVASKTSERRIIQSWLIGQYVDDRSVEFVESSASSAALTAEFRRLTRIPGAKDWSAALTKVPGHLDFRP